MVGLTIYKKKKKKNITPRAPRRHFYEDLNFLLLVFVWKQAFHETNPC